MVSSATMSLAPASASSTLRTAPLAPPSSFAATTRAASAAASAATTSTGLERMAV